MSTARWKLKPTTNPAAKGSGEECLFGPDEIGAAFLVGLPGKAGDERSPNGLGAFVAATRPSGQSRIEKRGPYGRSLPTQAGLGLRDGSTSRARRLLPPGGLRG